MAMITYVGGSRPSERFQSSDGTMRECPYGESITVTTADLNLLTQTSDWEAADAEAEEYVPAPLPGPYERVRYDTTDTGSLVDVNGNQLPVESTAQLGTAGHAAAHTATTSALATKAPLASPSLTGTPIAPTAAPGTSTTQVATTAFATAGLDVLRLGRKARLPKACYCGLAWSESRAARLLEMRKLVDMGIEVVRLQLPWAYAEASEGVFTWWYDESIDTAEEAGLKVIWSLETTPSWARSHGNVEGQPDNFAKLAAFATAAATRYKGRVFGWSIWNEPNSNSYWNGTPSGAAFASMVAAVAPAIRAADPSALIASGGTTAGAMSYIDAFLAAGGGANVDAIGFHNYCNNQAPETVTGAGGTVGNNDFRAYELVRAVMLARGVDKPIWLDEFGWTTAPTTVGVNGAWMTGVTEAVQGDYINRALNLLEGVPYVAQAIPFHVRDFAAGPPTSSSNPTQFFGFYKRDFEPKAAAAVMRNRPASGAASARASLGSPVSDDLDMLMADDPLVGEPAFPRVLISGSTALTSGVLKLAYLTARRSEPIDTMRIIAGTAWSGATPTVLRFAVYTVNADGSLTLLQSTAHDSTVANANGKVSEIPFQSGGYFLKERGRRYAIGQLCVTAGTAPTVLSMPVFDMVSTPLIAADVTGQANLPSTVTLGAQVASSSRAYSVMRP